MKVIMLQAKTGQSWEIRDDTKWFADDPTSYMKTVFRAAVKKCGSEENIKHLVRMDKELDVVTETFYLDGYRLKEID